MMQTKAVREVWEDIEVYGPRKYLGLVRDAIKATIIEEMREFGSSNKV